MIDSANLVRTGGCGGRAPAATWLAKWPRGTSGEGRLGWAR